jgi:hypothetical protein
MRFFGARFFRKRREARAATRGAFAPPLAVTKKSKPKKRNEK